RGAGGQRGVADVLKQGLALVVLELLLLPLGHDVDAGAVESGRYLPRMEGAVVVRVVPRQPPLVAALLPEGLHELDRLDGPTAIDHDLLAGLVRLGAPEGPEHRVREGGRVTEGVAESLAIRLALLLEDGEELSGIVPRLREFARSGVLQPRLAIGDGVAHDGVRDAEPLAVDVARGREHVIEPSLGLAELAGHIGHAGDSVLVV